MTNPIPLHTLSSNYLIAMLDAAPVAAWLKTPDGYYIYSNRASDEIMGRHVEGMTTEELYGTQADEIREYERAALETGCDQHVQNANGTPTLATRYRLNYRGHTLICGFAQRLRAI